MKHDTKAEGTQGIGVGDTIGGRYVVEAFLGQGGMAMVFRARNTGTDKLCALKVIHPHLAMRKGLSELFVREARIGSKIGASAYVVDVFDAGIDEGTNLPFLAMELLDGSTVQQMIERDGPIPAGLVATIVEQLGEALDQAHSAHVIHRDLKPSNLFLTHDRRGRPVIKVLDFGIAKVLEQDAHRTATEIGTPAYAAPEQLGRAFREIAQAQGVRVAADVSPATDLWALGLIVYEMLTGFAACQYWGAETASDLPLRMAMSLRDRSPASTRAGDRAGLLPPHFDDWFQNCMQVEADRRWRSAAEASQSIAQALKDFRGTGVTLGPTSSRQSAPQTRLALETFVVNRPSTSSTSTSRAPGSARRYGAETSLASMNTYAPQAYTPVPAEPASTMTRSRWIGVAVAACAVVVALGIGGRFALRSVRGDPSQLMTALASGASAKPPEPEPPVDRSTDLPSLEEDCSSGKAPSCIKLASRVRQGDGIAKDGNRANDLLKKACDLGDGTGCLALADVYLDSKESGSKARARELCHLACKAGSEAGCKKEKETAVPPAASTYAGITAVSLDSSPSYSSKGGKPGAKSESWAYK